MQTVNDYRAWCSAVTLGLPRFGDIGYKGVGGYHPLLNFVIILFKKLIGYTS